jgi:hypothetical protein
MSWSVHYGKPYFRKRENLKACKLMAKQAVMLGACLQYLQDVRLDPARAGRYTRRMVLVDPTH